MATAIKQARGTRAVPGKTYFSEIGGTQAKMRGNLPVFSNFCVPLAAGTAVGNMRVSGTS